VGSCAVRGGSEISNFKFEISNGKRGIPRCARNDVFSEAVFDVVDDLQAGKFAGEFALDSFVSGG